jgi:hypothetical protein
MSFEVISPFQLRRANPHFQSVSERSIDPSDPSPQMQFVNPGLKCAPYNSLGKLAYLEMANHLQPNLRNETTQYKSNI